MDLLAALFRLPCQSEVENALSCGVACGERKAMSDDEGTSLGSSDGDLSSADLSDGERGAKEMGPGGPGPPELGDAPPLLSGYSQTYIVRKQDPNRDQGRNRQVRSSR